MKQVLKVHPRDNVLATLTDLAKGIEVVYDNQQFVLQDRIPGKHKFAERDFAKGDEIIMYSVLVGRAQTDIPKGGLLSTLNVKHASSSFEIGERKTDWHPPDVSKFKSKVFYGYHRADGRVGTANHWLVIPMVFCESRNVDVLQEALVKQLGYGRNETYSNQVKELISLYKNGISEDELQFIELKNTAYLSPSERLFPNVDGIKDFIPWKRGISL